MSFSQCIRDSKGLSMTGGISNRQILTERLCVFCFLLMLIFLITEKLLHILIAKEHFMLRTLLTECSYMFCKMKSS